MQTVQQVSLNASPDSPLPSFTADQLRFKYRWRYTAENGEGTGATDDQAYFSQKKAEIQGDPDVYRYELYQDNRLIGSGGVVFPSSSSRPKWLFPALIGGGVLVVGGIVFSLIRRK